MFVEFPWGDLFPLIVVHLHSTNRKEAGPLLVQHCKFEILKDCLVNIDLLVWYMLPKDLGLSPW
jgi:hypothetical protein